MPGRGNLTGIIFMKKPLLMDLEDNVTLEGDVLVIIDRRRLPGEIVRLRCPDHEVVQELIRAAGGPIITTSANTSGKSAPGSFDELEERIIHAADLTLDGGETEHKLASTVVDCTGEMPVILRDGAIPAADILTVALGEAHAN